MIQPIETIYNNLKFRSRLEARWAVFFNYLNIKYEYEKEGYDLDNAGYYLPDFWLNYQEIWFEVKGINPTQSEKLKASYLANYTKHPVCIFYGKVAIDSLWEDNNDITNYHGGLITLPTDWGEGLTFGTFSSFCSWCECRECGNIFIDAPALETKHKINLELCDCKDKYCKTEKLKNAYKEANMARFDEGQNNNV